MPATSMTGEIKTGTPASCNARLMLVDMTDISLGFHPSGSGTVYVAVSVYEIGEQVAVARGSTVIVHSPGELMRNLLYDSP